MRPYVAATSLRRLARLIGAAAGDIALVPSASYGTATAALNIPVKAGQRIVVLAEQFPSNVYAWRELAKRTRARWRINCPDTDRYRMKVRSKSTAQ